MPKLKKREIERNCYASKNLFTNPRLPKQKEEYVGSKKRPIEKKKKQNVLLWPGSEPRSQAQKLKLNDGK